MMDVSVIIPVYNGEKYLRPCLDSVCAQTLQQIEIICVDDCSVDGSWEILQHYADADPRISLHHLTQNVGLGDARDYGMQYAQGKYVIFWDCDDYFDPKALQLLFEQAEKMQADVCVCGANKHHEQYDHRVRDGGYLQTSRVPESNLFNRVTNEDNILTFTGSAVWNKLFLRAFLQQENLNFAGLRCTEDFWFTSIALCKAEQITTVNKALINYRVRVVGNLCSTLDERDPRDPCRVFIKTALYLKEQGIFPERSFENKLMAQIMFNIRNMSQLPHQIAVVSYLQSVREELSIQPREEGYYDSRWKEQLAQHLLSDTPEEFLGWFAHENYLELQVTTLKMKDEKSKRTKLQKEKKQWQIQHAQVQERVGQLERAREAADRQNRELLTQNKVLQDSNAQLGKTVEQLEQERQALCEQIGQLEQTREAALCQIQELTNHNAQILASSECLKKKIKSLQAQNSELHQDKARLKKSLEKIRQSKAYRFSLMLAWPIRRIRDIWHSWNGRR